MENNIDVQIGEVRTCRGEAIMRTRAIGSCIAIAAYDPTQRIGSLAHAMLPGRASEKKESEQKTRYMANAIEAIIEGMTSLGAKVSDIQVFLVGGGNVLERDDDTICQHNIESAKELLKKNELKLIAHATGGVSRRTISFDVGSGIVRYTEGDSGEMRLWPM
ncbi:chemotaxis protein CheD [Planctomycetota bacterium]